MTSKRKVVIAVVALTVVVLAVAGFVYRQPRDQVSSARIEWVNGTSASTELEVIYFAGNTPKCGEPHGVQVSETPQSVTLTAQTITRDIPPEGRVCPLVAVPAKQVVTLDSPLGDRQVFDAFQTANGEPGIVEVKAPEEGDEGKPG